MKGDASQTVGDADYHFGIVFFYAFAKYCEFCLRLKKKLRIVFLTIKY